MTDLLLSVEKPARYVGGEFGEIIKEKAILSMAIAFPDLYEIGMSNQALKILYKNINGIDDVSCERVFAPAPDFEESLYAKGLSLYTLESRTPIVRLDILGFTLGYELGITGLLSILRSGGIPLLKSERTDDHPIILLGGPAVSNPVPFSSFVDAVWIGEAEDAFFSLVKELRDLKKMNKTKAELFDRITKETAIWIPGKKAYRSIDVFFSDREANPSVYPIPNMKIVQDHGSVEIMRGCPNGCRFCHAGIWYRPMRQKKIATIVKEVDQFIEKGGYREISLSSLSSGDYSDISLLVGILNKKYKNRNVSFQLPSLKVSSFSLPLLETISEVRKSGLTFAIETPVDAWQLSINKEVALDNVVSILKEAKLRGWKQAKFYFMIGLPVYPHSETSEEREIIDFLKKVRNSVNLSINVNIGTFVPKPHTPYQWCSQIKEEEANRKLKVIREALKPLGFKVSTHDPFVSVLEGLISRGDERIGSLIMQAFNEGCRLDAWEDHIKKDIWKSLLEKQGADILNELFKDKELEARLPWDDVFAGVGKKYLKSEYQKSIARILTSSCGTICTAPCGACNDEISVINQVASAHSSEAFFEDNIKEPISTNEETIRPRFTRRIVFSFNKKNKAIFWPHLSLVEIFSKAFIRASLPVQYSEGYNPLPKLDFASPLSLGIFAKNEIATIDMCDDVEESFFISKMNLALPSDISVISALSFHINEGVKKVSAASILWGFSYEFEGKDYTHLASDDKSFRENLRKDDHRIPVGLTRKNVYARNSLNEPISYFDFYSALYK